MMDCKNSVEQIQWCNERLFFWFVWLHTDLNWQLWPASVYAKKFASARLKCWSTFVELLMHACFTPFDFQIVWRVDTKQCKHSVDAKQCKHLHCKHWCVGALSCKHWCLKRNVMEPYVASIDALWLQRNPKCKHWSKNNTPCLIWVCVLSKVGDVG